MVPRALLFFAILPTEIRKRKRGRSLRTLLCFLMMLRFSSK